MFQEEVDFQIIANLMAGKGDAQNELERLEIFLKRYKKSYRLLVIDSPTPISKVPEDGRLKIKRGVICIGGDGTVSETVGYVLNNKIDTPIAIIPTGTANIIAGTLNLNTKKGDFSFLIKNKVKEIDVGIAEYQNEIDYFLLGLGIGFEENFLKLAKERFKNKFGIFSYIFAGLRELFSLEKIPIVIENSNLNIKTSICLLTVLNLHPIVLKTFPLFKDKRIQENDGLFNLYYVEYKNYPIALLGTLLFHFLGKKNFGLVKQVSGKEFLLKSPKVVGTQIDGELRSKLPVKISFFRRRINFYVH